MINVDGIFKSAKVIAHLNDTSAGAAKALTSFTNYPTGTQANAVHIHTSATTSSPRVTWDGTTTPSATVGTLATSKNNGEGLFIICDPTKVQVFQANTYDTIVTLFQV